MSVTQLLVAPVESTGRLASIYTEVKGWQIQANDRVLGGYSYKFEDFGDLVPEEKGDLDNYYTVAQKTAELIACKLGLCGDEYYDKFKDYTILAAFDRKGNLQGVTAAKMVGKKGIAAKVDYTVTAFWNMPFNEPKNKVRTRGAGTCMMLRLSELLPTKGAIFLESVGKSVDFYAKRFFEVVKGWVPKTEGAWCGMALYDKKFELLQGKAKGQMISCGESDLPPTIKHYLPCSPDHIRKMATEEKVS